MEKRIDDQVAVAFVEANQVAPDRKGAQVLLVGGDNPFRFAGGAGGENNIRAVLAGNQCNALFDLFWGDLQSLFSLG